MGVGKVGDLREICPTLESTQSVGIDMSLTGTVKRRRRTMFFMLDGLRATRYPPRDARYAV